MIACQSSSLHPLVQGGGSRGAAACPKVEPLARQLERDDKCGFGVRDHICHPRLHVALTTRAASCLPPVSARLSPKPSRTGPSAFAYYREWAGVAEQNGQRDWRFHRRVERLAAQLKLLKSAEQPP